IDGYQDIRKLSNEEVANSILERLEQIARGTRGRRTDAISAPAVTEDPNDVYSDAVRAIKGMLLPDEQMISQISGGLQVESSDQGFFERMTSMGHGTVVCTTQRLIAQCVFLPLRKKTTVVFEFSNIKKLAEEKAFTTELVITECSRERTRSVRITGELQ